MSASDNVVSLARFRGAAETRGVLLVSSNEPERLRITRSLREHGYRVRAVAGVDAALDELQANPWPVVVLDHDSPDADAVRFARIREFSVSYGADRLASVRVIAIGRQVCRESERDSDGIDAWLEKPLDAERLLQELARLMS